MHLFLPEFPLRTKSLSLNKEHSSELVFLILKLSSDDINNINFDLFDRLLKFVFTFLILLIIPTMRKCAMNTIVCVSSTEREKFNIISN
jgi:hypothetical protein